MIKPRLTYANVAATLALVFSMTGGALAAKHYLINSTKQISPKVIAALKGKTGKTGPAGPAGPQGPQGLQGIAGKEGPAGRSALTPLKSGETIQGIVGGRFQNGAAANSPMGAVASFPIPASTPLDNAHIQVAPSSNCTGTSLNPTAAAGFVCIYPSVSVSATKIEGDTAVAGNDIWGFQMEWETTEANKQSSVRATWAYTAP